MSAESLSSRLATWLLRPYLDLGPLRVGPLHVISIEECWRAFADPNVPRLIPQRAMAPAFRRQLMEQAGEPYVLTDPRQLSDSLRTERWREACSALDNWPTLSDDHRCRLAALLHSMCLYQPLLDLIPDTGFDVSRAGLDAIELAFWRASAKFMSQLPERTSKYDNAEMSIFESIAMNACSSGPSGFNSAAMVFVQKAKTRAAIEELVTWNVQFKETLSFAIDGADEFTTELFVSRFYRGTGFLSQRRGDRVALIQTMDRAEEHARRMKPSSPAQELLYRENLHAVMESRTKEALWLGDKDLALTRSLEVIKVDPYDAKAWVELGQVRYFRNEWREAAQAYGVAATLGPPAGAVGRHMAGVCLRELGLDLVAALFFKDTVESDPLGVSSREEIHTLPAEFQALNALKEWSRETMTL